jgi:dihydrodipicolinate synthase/N-acetylneuraminate lyase
MGVTKRYPNVMLTTACLPWTADWQLDEPVFRRSVRHLLACGIRHIYLFGTAGEGYDVTDAEFRRCVAVFREEMAAPGCFPMVCLVDTSPRHMQERRKIAYDLGIRDFQFALPSWGALNDREMLAFCHALCDEHPDCRFMHYNIGRSGRVLGLAQYQLLANEIPNLAAAKFTTRDTVVIHDLLTSDCPVQFFLTDMGYAYGSMLGECGFLVAISLPNPQVAKDYYEAGLRQDATTLFALEKRIGRQRKLLIDTVARCRGEVMDGAYDKLTVKLSCPWFPLRLRPPYSYLSDEQFAEYEKKVRELDPDWIQ